MADVVVTLSGDEARLFRAQQRIIQQQMELEAGYTDVEKAAKKAAREAEADAKKQAAATAKLNKSYQDQVAVMNEQAVAITKGKSAAIEMQAAREGLTKEQAASLRQQHEELELIQQAAAKKKQDAADQKKASDQEKSDAAKIEKSYNDQRLALERNIVAHKKGNAAAFEMKAIQDGLTVQQANHLRQLHDEVDELEKVKKAKQDQSKLNDNLLEKVGGMAAAWISIQGTVSTVTAGIEQQVALHEKSYQFALDLAKSQQEAAKNLAGVAPEQISATLQQTVPEIMLKAGFSDAEKVTTALGSVASIVGDKLAPAIVEVSAAMTNLNPDKLQETATAIADISKASGIKDGAEVMSMLLSTGAVARPEDMGKLAGGATKVITSAISASPGQDKVDASREAMALYASLTPIDPTGQSASTNGASFIAQLGDLFKEVEKSRTKNADEIKKLESKLEVTDQEAVRIRRAEFDVSQAETAVKRFGDATTPEADDARIKLDEAKSRLKTAQQASTLDDEEKSKLEKLRTEQAAVEKVVDPKTLAGRKQILQENKYLQSKFKENMKGEEVFKPFFEGLITKDSKQSDEFDAALANITTDKQKFEDAKETMLVTPQQRQAQRKERRKAFEAVRKMRDGEGNAYAETADIAAETEWNTSKGALQGMASFWRPLGRSLEQTYLTPTQFANTQLEQAKFRREQLTTTPEATQKNVDTIRVIDESIRQYEELLAEQKEANRLMREQNELLKNAADNKPSGPTPAAIRAQGAQKVVGGNP